MNDDDAETQKMWTKQKGKERRLNNDCIASSRVCVCCIRLRDYHKIHSMACFVNDVDRACREHAERRLEELTHSWLLKPQHWITDIFIAWKHFVNSGVIVSDLTLKDSLNNVLSWPCGLDGLSWRLLHSKTGSQAVAGIVDRIASQPTI